MKPTPTTIRQGGLVAFGVVLAATVTAQEPRFHHPNATSETVSVRRGVVFAQVDSVRLSMDVYRPSSGPTGGPVIVVFAQGNGAQREIIHNVGWATVLASAGMVTVVADLRFGQAGEDFERLISALRQPGSEVTLADGTLGVLAASGNVATALPLLSRRATEGPPPVWHPVVGAAAMLYGGARVEQLRGDLPLLLLRAGLDRPPVNAALDELAAKAAAQNVPLTVVNHAGGHHGFEAIDPGAASVAAIDQVVDFFRRSLSEEYRASVLAQLPEATAAGAMATGDYQRAVAGYAALVANAPGNGRLRLAYGEVLLAARQFETACRQFAGLEGARLGPRDLGMPAARACAQAGDPDAAIRWLRFIPERFRPPGLASDPGLASLRGRPDFEALFR